MKRYYFASTIKNFLNISDNEILAELDRGSREFVSLYGSQGRAWDKELEDLRPLLTQYEDRGTIIFEYTIPRLGRRIDVVLLIDGIVFILEYKAFKKRVSKCRCDTSFRLCIRFKTLSQRKCKSLHCTYFDTN